MIGSAPSAIVGLLARTLEIVVEYCDGAIQTNAQALVSARLHPDDLPLAIQIEQLIGLIADAIASSAGTSAPVMLRQDDSFVSMKQRALLVSLFLRSVHERADHGIAHRASATASNYSGKNDSLLDSQVILKVVTSLSEIYNTLRASGVNLASPEFLFLPRDYRLNAEVGLEGASRGFDT